MRKLGRRAFLLSGSSLLFGDLPDDPIGRAFARMYNFDFPGTHAIVDRFVQDHSQNPLGYGVRGAGYLFGELDRLGILEADFFMDDERIADKKGLKPDPKVRDAFYWANSQCRDLAETLLKQNPRDTNALFCLSMSYGLLTDYSAFVEKKQIASLSYARNSQKYAVQLLTVDPEFTDAYLTTGLHEYILGSLPFFLRWFVKFEQAKGSKEQAVINLRMAAAKGRYLGPFARILLAVVALREKRREEARNWLDGLVKDFPENPLLRRELAKVSTFVK